jgi:type I restriction enzyme S subunit
MSQFIEMFGNPVTNTKGWKTAKIKDVAPEMPSKEQLSGKIWLLNLDMIESNTGRIIEKVYEDVENALSVQSFDEGNVLFSKLRPYLNKVVIPDEPGMATTELVPLRPEPSKLHKVFLSHLLRGNQFVNYANDIAGGTKMPRMPLTELRNFDCILPPMDKQLEFVFIAEQVDKSEFVGCKSQFIEMFGDTHMRSDHSRQWKEVVEIINGKDYKSIQVEDGGYPVYGTGGEMARASDYLSPANSILLGRKGTIDKPLLIREKYWNVDTAFGAVPDEKVLHYVYFYWHCKTIDFNVLNKGTTLPSTTKVDLLNLWIKIPSMEEQTRFGSIVEQADKSKYYN